MHSNANPRRIRQRLCAASAVTLIAALGAAPTLAAAQTAQTPAAVAEPTIAFNAPAGPLDKALRRFADQTGFQMVYDTTIVQGLKTVGVSGRMTPQEALARLLAGTALTFHMPEPHTVIIEAVPASIAGARTLGPVQVEGVQTQGFAALNGFGAGAGSNGSSDPTATEGTHSLTTNGAEVASKTPQSLKDTPQSVTVITAERIQEQNLTDLASALEYTPGITVASPNGGIQPQFYSRGFTISAFQIDGGAPLDLGVNSNYSSTPNLGEFDNIQVLRGSDALFGGQSEPGGVVSLSRKRPLDHYQFLGEVDVGSWNNYEVQLDATGPIAFDGHLRGRLVVSDQDRDYFYETAHQNKSFVYGVLEADLGPNTILRAGGSYEHQDNQGFDGNGLPRYANGADLGLSRSTNLAAPWSYFDLVTPEVFASLEHRFDSDWGLKINFTRLAQNNAYAENTISNTIATGNTTTHARVQSGVAEATNTETKYAADATLNGALEVFGLTQKLTVGADYSSSVGSGINYANHTKITTNDLFNFDPDSLNPEPARPKLASTTPTKNQEQWGGYVTLDMQPIKNLHLIGGVRDTSYESQFEQDTNLGFLTIKVKTSALNAGNLTPYGAIRYDLIPEVSLYASYADIFTVQANELSPSGSPLPPTAGVTYETGIKGAFRGGKLNASLSYYYTDQSNQETPDPDTASCVNPNNCYLINGAVISEGVDFEVSGEILPNWQVQAGYTYNVNHYNQAEISSGNVQSGFTVFQSQQPSQQFKLWTTYTPVGRFDRWTLGGGLRLESARSEDGFMCNVALTPVTGACPSGVTVPFAFTQGLYTVVDLRAGYKINSHLQASLDITNIGDTRYYSTINTPTGDNFYGEPRAFMFSLRARY